MAIRLKTSCHSGLGIFPSAATISESVGTVGLIHSNSITKLSSKVPQSKHFSIRAIRGIVAASRYVWLINHGLADPPTKNRRYWIGRHAIVLDRREHIRENGRFYVLEGLSKVEVSGDNPEYRIQSVFNDDSDCLTIGLLTEAVCGVRRDLVIEVPPTTTLVDKKAKLSQIGKDIRAFFAVNNLDLIDDWHKISISGIKKPELELIKQVALGSSDVPDRVDLESLNSAVQNLFRSIS